MSSWNHTCHIWIYRLMVVTGHHCSLSSLHKSSIITSTLVTSLQMFSPILDAFDDRKQVFVQLFQDKMRKPAGGSGDWIPKNAWSGDSSKILGEAISFLSFARTKGWERQGWKHDSYKMWECFRVEILLCLARILQQSVRRWGHTTTETYWN